MAAEVRTVRTSAPIGQAHTNDDASDYFELRNVWKSFGSESVLRGVDLRLVRGECLGIIGPSGGGKSVLLKCMIGLLPIDGGALLFDGKSVPSMRQQEQVRLRQRVGFLFQAGVLFDSISVRENLEYPLREHFFRTMGRGEMEARVAWALDAVGLPLTEAATMPADLSGGMTKRVGIARAIITRPDVVLYDCPTEGLDPPNAHRISDLLVDLRKKQGITSVVVSHDLRTVFSVCQRVAFLKDGRMLEIGTPASLAESDNIEVRDFIIGHPPEQPFDPREFQPPVSWQTR
jgi:phospholipid/cholesterol/gamma-HCH transport system ATP-binding protein